MVTCCGTTPLQQTAKAPKQAHVLNQEASLPGSSRSWCLRCKTGLCLEGRGDLVSKGQTGWVTRVTTWVIGVNKLLIKSPDPPSSVQAVGVGLMVQRPSTQCRTEMNCLSTS